MKTTSLFLLLSLAFSSAFAQGIPARDFAKVLDFYFSESNEIVAYDSRLCDFITESTNPEEQCAPHGKGPLETAQEVYWQFFLFAPFGMVYSIRVEIFLNDTRLRSESVSIEGSFLMVLPVKLVLSEPGEWKVRLYHIDGNEKNPLIERTVTLGH